MIRFEVQENVTEYLTKLQEHFEGNQEAWLDKLTQELVFDYIGPLVPEWEDADSEGNLRESGEDPENWFKNISQTRSIVEILYTGFTELMEHSHVFWEMGGYSTQAYASLKRDYAFYQETGKDLYHPLLDRGEAPRFEGHHYVQRGTENFVKSERMKHMTAQYLMEIMELK